MAVKKVAPKKAAKSSIKTAKKAVAPKRAAVKTAVKKSAPVRKTPSKKSSLKKVKVAVAVKKVTPKKGIILKTPISKPMAKKVDVKQVKTKKEDETPVAKKNGTSVPKKTSEPVVKKQLETLEEVATTVTNKKTATPAPVTEIKIPKTTVKTSVPYHPEYKTLDQRQTVANGKTNAPLVRYNDNELNEFKDLINKKWDAAKKELAYLQGLITRRDDQGGDEGDNRYMTMEDGSMSMEREQLSQMASRQITYIDHLEKALIRIENKTYGICRVTGKLIDKARLRAVPHATLSLEAKLGLVKPGTE